MTETHATSRTWRPARPHLSAPQAADLTKRMTVIRAELEATRRDNDGLRRSSARLRAENARLVLQFKRRSAAPDRRSAMRDALLDRCSLNP
jgi:hypothetical protein